LHSVKDSHALTNKTKNIYIILYNEIVNRKISSKSKRYLLPSKYNQDDMWLILNTAITTSITNL